MRELSANRISMSQNSGGWENILRWRRVATHVSCTRRSPARRRRGSTGAGWREHIAQLRRALVTGAKRFPRARHRRHPCVSAAPGSRLDLVDSDHVNGCDVRDPEYVTAAVARGRATCWTARPAVHFAGIGAPLARVRLRRHGDAVRLTSPARSVAGHRGLHRRPGRATARLVFAWPRELAYAHTPVRDRVHRLQRGLSPR